MFGRFLWEARQVTGDLSIDIDEIRAALSHVLNAVERDHGPRLRVASDAYWSLPVSAAYDLSESDPALAVGQLRDDVDAMREVLNKDGHEIVAVWHDWPTSSVSYAR